MKKSRIFIVEDEYIIGRQIQLMLKDLGYDAGTPVARGEQVLSLLTAEPWDLVLMDIRLAGKLTGIETAERIRETIDIPIIYLTAHGDPEMIQKAKATHPYAFLTKPCSAKDLQAAVEISLMRKEITKADERARQIWQNTFDAVPDLVFTVDEHFIIQRVNRAMAERLGEPSDGIIGRKCHKVIHGLQCNPVSCPHFGAVNTGAECRIEGWEQKLDGYFITTISPIVNGTNKISGYVHVLRDITKRRHIEEERERLVGELESALSEIKTLSGLLPICSGCKNIRDDKGYWRQIEEYITHHSKASFSHAICPECMAELYPEIVDQISKNKETVGIHEKDIDH